MALPNGAGTAWRAVPGFSAAYLLRAAYLPLLLLAEPQPVTAFWIRSSAIVAICGAADAIGTALGWRTLGR